MLKLKKNNSGTKRLRMSGGIHVLPLYALVACKSKTLHFLLYIFMEFISCYRSAYFSSLMEDIDFCLPCPRIFFPTFKTSGLFSEVLYVTSPRHISLTSDVLRTANCDVRTEDICTVTTQRVNVFRISNCQRTAVAQWLTFWRRNNFF